VTPSDRVAAQAALTEGRAVYGRLDQIRGPEDAAADIIQVLDAVQHSEEAQQSLRYWVERHFGDATPGVATERFHAAVDELIRKWEVEAAIHAGDAFANEVEPRDEENDES